MDSSTSNVLIYTLCILAVMNLCILVLLWMAAAKKIAYRRAAFWIGCLGAAGAIGFIVVFL